MIGKIISIIGITLLTTSCSVYHITSSNTTDSYYPSTSIEDVVYLETIDQDHEIIGVVTINAERRQYLSNVIVRMRREAAVLGGDAITDIQTDATGTWKRLPVQQTIGNAYVRANFTASVVSFEHKNIDSTDSPE